MLRNCFFTFCVVKRQHININLAFELQPAPLITNFRDIICCKDVVYTQHTLYVWPRSLPSSPQSEQAILLSRGTIGWEFYSTVVQQIINYFILKEVNFGNGTTNYLCILPGSVKRFSTHLIIVITVYIIKYFLGIEVSQTNVHFCLSAFMLIDHFMLPCSFHASCALELLRCCVSVTTHESAASELCFALYRGSIYTCEYREKSVFPKPL